MIENSQKIHGSYDAYLSSQLRAEMIVQRLESVLETYGENVPFSEYPRNLRQTIRIWEQKSSPRTGRDTETQIHIPCFLVPVEIWLIIGAATHSPSNGTAMRGKCASGRLLGIEHPKAR